MPLPLSLLLILQAEPAPVTDPSDVPAIVITGRDLPPPAGESAFATVTLDAQAIAGPERPLVENTIRLLGGVQQFRRSDSRSASPTSQGLTLRGLGGNASSRTLVLLDGVPLSDPFGGWINWTALERQRIARATLTRGGGTGADGPGALAGTLSLESGTHDGLAVRVGGGSFGTGEGSVSAGVRVGGGSIGLGGDYARSNGFVPVVRGDRGAADIPARYRRGGVTARWVAPVGASGELQTTVAGFGDDRSRGVRGVGSTTTGGDLSVRFVGRGRWQTSALVYGQLRKLTATFAAVADARSSTRPVLNQYNVPSSGVGGRFEVRPPLAGTVALRLGADVRRVEGETREAFLFDGDIPTRLRRAGTETTTLGGFVAGDWRIAPILLLTGSARLDRWSIDNTTRVERDTDGTPRADERVPGRSGVEPTGRVGALLTLSPTLDLRAAASLGWRLPTINELARPFRVGADATAANPALSPERSRTVEAGADWRLTDGVTLSATAFDARVTDAVANVTLARGPGVFPGVGFVSGAGVYRQRLNVDAVESRGVELDATARGGPFDARLSLSALDARVRDSGPSVALDGRRPAQVANLSGAVTIGWRPAQRVRLEATLDHTGAQFEDDGNTRRLAAATVLDLGGSLPIARRLIGWARVENALGERVAAAVDDQGVLERARPKALMFGLTTCFN